jgi:hypothetical protein
MDVKMREDIPYSFGHYSCPFWVKTVVTMVVTIY